MLFSKLKNLRRRLRWWILNDFPLSRGQFKYCGSRVFFPRHCHLLERLQREKIFESELVDGVLKSLNAGGVYFDVGANIGLLAVPILQRKPDVVVHSFEPSPTTIKFLQRTWEANPHRERWKINEIALGAAEGTATFYVHSADVGAFDGLSDTGRAGEAKKVDVAVSTLDTYWTSIGCPKVDCIKIDVEGFEVNVLQGGRRLLTECRPIVFLEWTELNLDSSTKPGLLLDTAKSLSASVYTYPFLQPIRDEDDLKVAMRFGESFILVAKGG